MKPSEVLRRLGDYWDILVEEGWPNGVARDSLSFLKKAGYDIDRAIAAAEAAEVEDE